MSNDDLKKALAAIDKLGERMRADIKRKYPTRDNKKSPVTKREIELYRYYQKNYGEGWF